MESFTKTDLDILISCATGPCVSIFMPTHKAGLETLQGPLRLKNRLREARRLLEDGGLRPAAIEQLLGPMSALVSDYEFWQHQRDGLALYRSSEFWRLFRLPIVVEDSLVVADRFRVKPLLRLLTDDELFHVLALSQNSVRLLECTRDRVHEIELPHVVKKQFAEFLRYRRADTELQMHSIAQRGKSHGYAIFHTQRGDSGEKRDKLLGYFREIDRSLRGIFRNNHAPLILAAVEYCFHLFKSATGHRNLVEEGIFGNTDRWRMETLHAKAWAIVERELTKRKAAAVARYAEALRLQRASSDAKKIIPAACEGRIDQLIVAQGRRQWGRFDLSHRFVELCPQAATGSEDLLDLAAVQTLRRGGLVYAVEPPMIPHEATMGAVLRY